MKVIYNVTVSVDVDASHEWLEWMKQKHIPEVMETGMFLEAKISKVLGEESGGKTYAIQYLCESMEIYEIYQRKCAPSLQADHTKKYGNKTAAFRTLLVVHESYDKKD